MKKPEIYPGKACPMCLENGNCIPTGKPCTTIDAEVCNAVRTGYVLGYHRIQCEKEEGQ